MMNAFVSRIRRPERASRAPAVLGFFYLMPELRTARSGLMVICFLVGCENKSVTRLVEGSVTFAGKPLDHGMLGFRPTTGKLVGAPILPDGKYAVELSPGDYQVTVNAPQKLPEGFQEGDPLPPPDPNALPEKYNRQETSGLSAQVEAGSGPQRVDFEME